jgi:hypothetical protein
MVKFVKQKHAADTKAECEHIYYNTKPTLKQHLAAILPPTYTPIIPKPILLNFKKLTLADLIRIFELNSKATLKCLDIFESFQIKKEVLPEHIKNLWCLIERLTHLKHLLKDTSCHGTWLYPVIYSDFPLFFPVLLSPLEAFLAFAQSKRPF